FDATSGGAYALRDKTLKDRRLVIGGKVLLIRGSNLFEQFGHELKDKAGGAGIAFKALCHHALQQRTLLRNLEAALSFADRDFLGELLRQIGLEVESPFRSALGVAGLARLEFRGLRRAFISDPIIAVVSHLPAPRTPRLPSAPRRPSVRRAKVRRVRRHGAPGPLEKSRPSRRRWRRDRFVSATAGSRPPHKPGRSRRRCTHVRSPRRREGSNRC